MKKKQYYTVTCRLCIHAFRSDDLGLLCGMYSLHLVLDHWDQILVMRRNDTVLKEALDILKIDIKDVKCYSSTHAGTSGSQRDENSKDSSE